MAYTIIQIAGNDYADGAAYTGPSRELRVDTDNWDLLIQDGITPGGHRLLNETNSDARYQQSNAELAGIGPFTSAQTGYLARIGAYSYALRSFTTTQNDIVITYPDGASGASNFALAATLPNNYTFSGNVTFDDAIAATAGLVGNVTGNLTGNVTGNITGNGTGTWTGPVNGNVTGNLVGNVTGSVTGGVTGNVVGNVSGTSANWNTPRTVTFSGADVAGNFTIDGSANVGPIALTLNNLTGTSPAGNYQSANITVDAKGRVTAASNNTNITPSGCIMMWPTVAIPSGWYTCNGQSLSRTANPNLAAVAAASGYGAPFGAGDGSTTFTVPDMRGLFIRALDQGAGIDPLGGARTIGSIQAFASHGHAHAPYNVGAGATFEMHTTASIGTSYSTSGTGLTTASSTAGIVDDPAGTMGTTTGHIDIEERPVNMALIYIIKGG